MLAVSLFASASLAGDLSTWTGLGADSNWGTNLNWSPTTAPNTTGTYSLVFSGSIRTTSTNTIGTITVDSIAFSNNVPNSSGPFFTINGGTGFGLNLLNATITTGSSANTAAADGDIIGMPLSLTGANTVSLGRNHMMTLRGDISGAGSLTYGGNGLTAQANTLYVTGSNSYAGGTTINAGLAVSTGDRTGATFNSNAFGAGDVTVNSGGTILLRNSSTLSQNISLIGTGIGGDAFTGSFGTTGVTAILSGTTTLLGDASMGASGGANAANVNTFRISGGVNLNANTLTFRPDRAGQASKSTIDVTGVIAGTGGVTINSPSGSGEVQFDAINTFTGTTNINSGILSGTGSVPGLLSVNSGSSIFSPGTSGTSKTATAVFGVGSFAQLVGGTTQLQVLGTTPGTQYDQVLFSGTSKTISWGGNLELTLSGSYADLTEFSLFKDFTSATGSLAGITLAATGSPYQGLSFVLSGTSGVWTTGTVAAPSPNAGQSLRFNEATGILVVVPEPTALGLAVAAITVLGGAFHMRRRKTSSPRGPGRDSMLPGHP